MTTSVRGNMHFDDTSVENVNPVPPKGLSLGWRLCFYTSAIVAIFMGSLLILEESRETNFELRQIVSELQAALAPLKGQIEAAPDLFEAERAVSQFHQAYVGNGQLDHHLILQNAQGSEIFSTVARGSALNFSAYNHAAIPILNPVIAGGEAVLIVFEDNLEFLSNRIARRRRAVAHLGSMLLVVFLVLHFLTRRLVTNPLNQLLEGIRKTEMGYWGESETVEGAWEIRWINWRFQNMGRELNRTVQDLFQAEQRAAKQGKAPVSIHAEPSEPLSENTLAAEDGAQPRLQSKAIGKCVDVNPLEEKCAELEEMTPGDTGAREAAWAALDNWAFDSERAGELALKIRFENAAIRILETDDFARIEQQIGIYERSCIGTLSRFRSELTAVLDKQLVPVLHVQGRRKHAAGVWLKMRAKNLKLSQIHDLYAVRVIVPTEADCYWALGIVHSRFAPVIGRFKDYIANPKSNGYRSIHTSLRMADGQVFEVQLRTAAMHSQAERGAAAHLNYKIDGHHTSIRGNPERMGVRKIMASMFRMGSRVEALPMLPIGVEERDRG